MPRLSFSDVSHLRNTLIRDRGRFLETWRKRAKVMSPRRFNDNPNDKNRGERKDQELINTLVRRALRTFVSGMMNGSTPRTRQWFKLVALDEKKGNSTAARRWFAEVEKIITAHFQASNLYRILPSAYKDVGVFDNAAYAMLPHPRFGFYFQPFTIGTFAYANDSEGNTTTFMRDFNLSVRQTIETYGQLKSNGHIDWSNMDPWIKSAWESARYLDNVLLYSLIVPNKMPKENALMAEDKPFQSYTYVNGVGNNLPSQSPNRGFGNTAPQLDRNFISVKGFDYFPIITPRWEVAAEEDYGDEGPGCIALGDVNTHQELEKGRLEAVDKLLRPPMVGPAALRRVQASILAGGITYLDEQDSTKQFRPAFTVDPKINELIGVKEDYERAINSSFFVDLFLMLANERSISHVSAREIEEKAAEKLSAIGPVLGQLDQDQNRRLIENGFRLLAAQGKLPPKPKDLENEEIRPEYISILAQAQKAQQINDLERLSGYVANVAQASQDPSLLKLIKWDKKVRQYAEFLGVDPSLILDEIEYEQVQIQQQLLEQQARVLAAQQQQSETARNLSQAKTDEPNLLSEVRGAQAAS